MRNDGQEYLKCTHCGEYVNSSEAEAHRCPESAKPKKKRKANWVSQKIHRLNCGDACPACGGRTIEALSAPNVDAEGATQGVHCCDCGAQWLDCYKLTGYIKTGEPE